MHLGPFKGSAHPQKPPKSDIARELPDPVVQIGIKCQKKRKPDSGFAHVRDGLPH